MAAVAALVAISFAASVVAATSETRVRYVTRGLDYLHAQQQTSGGWGSPQSTAMAVLGAIASGERMGSSGWHVKGKNPFDYLQATDLVAGSGNADVSNAPIYYSRLIMAYVALGRGSTIGAAGSKRANLLTLLKGYQDTSDSSLNKGAFAPALPSLDSAVRTTSWALLAMHNAGVPHNDAGFSSAAAWLAAQQNGNGGFSTNAQGGSSNALDTALAIQALKVSASAAAWDQTAARAFLDGAQRANGGFSSSAGGGTEAEATAVVVQAIVALGENPDGSAWTTSRGETPITALHDLLASNGSYKASASSRARPVMVTGWVLTALNKKPFTTYPRAKGNAHAPFKFRPQVTSVSPKNGAKFTDTRVVLIKASYTDLSPKGTGIQPSASRLYVNGQNRSGPAEIGEHGLRLLLKNVPNGTHTYKIELRDRAGNTKVIERKFTVAIPTPPGSSSGGSSSGSSSSSSSGSGGSALEPDSDFPIDSGADDDSLLPETEDGESEEPFPYLTPTESASPLITGTPLPSPSASAAGSGAGGGGGAAGYVGGTLLAMLPIGAVAGYLLLQRRAAALGNASRGTVLRGGGSSWERFKHTLARSRDLTRPASGE